MYHHNFIACYAENSSNTSINVKKEYMTNTFIPIKTLFRVNTNPRRPLFGRNHRLTIGQALVQLVLAIVSALDSRSLDDFFAVSFMLPYLATMS